MKDINIKLLIEKALSSKGAGNGLHIKEITDFILKTEQSNLFNQLNFSQEELYNKIQSTLNREVKKTDTVFLKVKNANGKSFKKGYYKLKRGVRPKPNPIKPLPQDEELSIVPPAADQEDVNPQRSTYVGKAGECAVMSELLFRGYNVNSMLVDEGVDIVASKLHRFYYYQVKTTELKSNNTIHATLKKTRFESFIGTQIKYVIVARCLIGNLYSNLYFIFSDSDILRFEAGRFLKISGENIYIKIKIDDETGVPYIYDDRYLQDISFNKNRFE